MPKFFTNRWRGYHIVALFILLALFMGVLTSYRWQFGVAGYLVLLVLVGYIYNEKNAFERDVEEFVKTLTIKINKAGEEAITEMPFGVLVFSDQRTVEWANPFISSFFGDDIINESIADVSEELDELLQQRVDEKIVNIRDVAFYVKVSYKDRMMYLFDVTEYERLKQKLDDEKVAIALISLDNYDEVTKGMEEQVKSRLISQVTSSLNDWAKEYGFLLKRIATDRFIAMIDMKTLKLIEEGRFAILDTIREQSGKENIPLTLSIGVGVGEKSLRELGKLAESSHELALGRGGDQVAIKQKDGKVRFYGGKSNAVEKRTRVRARVISHALRDFVVESDKVFIMGHKFPDMDAIGAAIGVLKIAEVNGRDGYIIINPTDIDHDVKKLMEEIEQHDYLWSHFITPKEAKELVTPQTLLVVVDTHKPSLVVEPQLLERVERVVVLDHHRRGEEFIEEPVLVYMEPYASSTSELVTELLEYQPKKVKMDRLEATALLAGIIVDTKSFAVRTGSRTFDAASYLRSNGADTTLVQQLLKEDLEQYVKRANLVKNAEPYVGWTAIAVADDDERYSQVVIAQAADTLLMMKGVVASFVISRREDGIISISARSLGEVNVQLIMERLNGGGHLTNAAAQLEDVDDLEEAKRLLQKAIDEYMEGGN